MQAETLCPKCGKWRELEDYTGWCSQCSLLYASPPPQVNGKTRYCLNCGDPIYSNRKDARFCSKPKCRHAKEKLKKLAMLD